MNDFLIGYPLIRHLVLFDELVNCAIRSGSETPHFSYEQDSMTPTRPKSAATITTYIKLSQVGFERTSENDE